MTREETIKKLEEIEKGMLEFVYQTDEPSKNWWYRYCDCCKSKDKLPPYCVQCRNHELVPYNWKYDDTRECEVGQ